MYTKKWRIFDTGQFLSAFIYLNCTGQQCKNLRKAALQSIGQMTFNIDVLAIITQFEHEMSTETLKKMQQYL